MNCVNHPDVAAVAYCRSCGKALCEQCQKSAAGTIYCEEHAPAPRASAWTPPPNPYSAASSPPVADTSASPGLAFLLGLIPGVGAIYNGQYAKGLVHVIVFGLLISVQSAGAVDGLEPLFGMLSGVWFFYMAFEAYHTARKRQLGQPVDEFSSIIPVKGTGSSPVAPILLIAVGTIFLLHNLEIVRFYQILRYWPVFLIVLGVYMLYNRLNYSETPHYNREATNEHQ